MKYTTTDKPFARRSGNIRYFTEQEYNKTFQEIYADKQDRKARKEAETMQASNLANKLMQQITQSILQFRRGEICAVDVIEIRDEIQKKYQDETSQMTCMSKFEIEQIWNNAVKKERGKWWA